MCKFTLSKAESEGKTKIGLIFNEDYHYQEGSHWICAFLDIPKRTFYFIDSVGNPMPKEVADFAERLSRESETLYGEKLSIVASTMPHQRGNNQCGMYCLFFIISLLTGTATYEELMQERIPDGAMQELRRFLFRHATSTDKHSKSKSTPKSSRKPGAAPKGRSKTRRSKGKGDRRIRTARRQRRSKQRHSKRK